MSYFKNILLIVIVCYSTKLTAQWNDITLDEFSNVILDMEKQIPKDISYAFKADYYFFEQLTSTDTTNYLSMELLYHSKSNTINFDQFGRFIIQTKELQIICDTSNMAIILNYPSAEFNKRKVTEDFSKLLNSQCTAKKRITDKFKIYYLEFAPNAPFKGTEIWIDKEGLVKKYILYTNRELLDDTGETEKLIMPRMEVVYSDYLFGAAADKKKMVGTDLYFKDVTNKVLQDQFLGYEIIDLRID